MRAGERASCPARWRRWQGRPASQSGHASGSPVLLPPPWMKGERRVSPRSAQRAGSSRRAARAASSQSVQTARPGVAVAGRQPRQSGSSQWGWWRPGWACPMTQGCGVVRGSPPGLVGGRRARPPWWSGARAQCGLTWVDVVGVWVDWRACRGGRVADRGRADGLVGARPDGADGLADGGADGRGADDHPCVSSGSGRLLDRLLLVVADRRSPPSSGSPSTPDDHGGWWSGRARLGRGRERGWVCRAPAGCVSGVVVGGVRALWVLGGLAAIAVGSAVSGRECR